MKALRWSREEYEAHLAKANRALAAGETPPKKPAKYRNTVAVVNGVRFDSRKEYRVWLTLVAAEERGEIRELRRQVKFPIIVDGELICTYVADATYFRGERFVIEDAKSAVTRRNQLYRCKKALMRVVLKREITEV